MLALVQVGIEMTVLKCAINFIIGVFIFIISAGIADAAIVHKPSICVGDTNQE
jgi:hypothetical protein